MLIVKLDILLYLEFLIVIVHDDFLKECLACTARPAALSSAGWAQCVPCPSGQGPLPAGLSQGVSTLSRFSAAKKKECVKPRPLGALKAASDENKAVSSSKKQVF
jgi:hypothetical protein